MSILMSSIRTVNTSGTSPIDLPVPRHIQSIDLHAPRSCGHCQSRQRSQAARQRSLTNQRMAVQVCWQSRPPQRTQGPPRLLAQASKDAGPGGTRARGAACYRGHHVGHHVPMVMVGVSVGVGIIRVDGPGPGRAQAPMVRRVRHGVVPETIARTSPGRSARGRIAEPDSESAFARPRPGSRRSTASYQWSASLATSKPEASCSTHWE